ncbi:phosphate signaling complex protein PhoU [Enterococcus nangangensis]|uniref:phosphate signaling complex protein PhoU n=1 Tax=Enterococcus nangangensis TaxID=2559926 RepID=UPI001485AFC6|nr:phosphate signaling complex protein PhoU [Enterococcus nangangensis]
MAQAHTTPETVTLNRYFLQLGQLADAEINQVITAFIQHDKSSAQEILDEKKINGKDDTLERLSLNYIVLKQPVAADFRLVISILKASSDLDRIREHAASIAQETIRVKGNLRVKKIEESIAALSLQVRDMLSAILQAFIALDPDKARNIAQKDDEVDARYQTLREQITLCAMEDSQTVPACFSYFMVIRLLERIGDHIVNLAKWTIYHETGELEDLT